MHSLSEMQMADCSTCLFRCCCCNRTVSGYDFVVNAVWPEVVANIEAKTPSIFAPGNPNVFHEVCNCKQVTRTVCLISLMNYSQWSSLYGRPQFVDILQQITIFYRTLTFSTFRIHVFHTLLLQMNSVAVAVQCYCAFYCNVIFSLIFLLFKHFFKFLVVQFSEETANWTFR